MNLADLKDTPRVAPTPSPINALIARTIEQTALTTVNPADLVANDNEAIASTVAMIAGYNMEQELPTHEVQMLVECCRRFNVTKSELVDAFWNAYADKYTGKRMYFRHLWTYISAERAKATPPAKVKFAFEQVMAWLAQRNLPLDYTPFFNFHGIAGVKSADNFYTLKDGVYDGR